MFDNIFYKKRIKTIGDDVIRLINGFEKQRDIIYDLKERVKKLEEEKNNKFL